MIEMQSSDSPEVILARVKEVLPTPWEWQFGGGHGRTPFYGKVKEGGFWVMKCSSRFERNSVNPVLVAWVRPAQHGSRVTATVRIPYVVQGFLALWCLMALGIGSVVLYKTLTGEFASDGNVAPVFAIAMATLVLTAGIGYVAAREVNKRRRPALEAWLREIVKAS